MDRPRRTGFDARRPAAAVALALIAPAALFFVAVVGRSLQPIEHEPARTLDQVARAFFDLPAAVGIVVIAIAPVAALLLAAAVVWWTFATDPTLKGDIARLAGASVPILRRPTFLVALVVTGAALAMAVFLIVHAIVG